MKKSNKIIIIVIMSLLVGLGLIIGGVTIVKSLVDDNSDKTFEDTIAELSDSPKDIDDTVDAVSILVKKIESGSPFTMDIIYYSNNEKTGDYTNIDFDGTTYLIEDMLDKDLASFTCEKGTEDCEDVEEVIQDELEFLEASFDEYYDQEISTDDNYNYSKGETEANQKYQVKVSNDGKTAVDEFNIEESQGVVITTTVK